MEQQKKNGGYYLKKKIAELEAEIAALKEKAERASKLQKDLNVEVREHKALEESYVRLKNDKDKVIEKQASEISKLVAEKASAESDARFYKSIADKYWNAMGWLRRWWYERTQM